MCLAKKQQGNENRQNIEILRKKYRFENTSLLIITLSYKKLLIFEDA